MLKHKKYARNTKRKQLLWFAAIILVLALAGGILYAYAKRTDERATTKPTVNLRPPTKDEEQQVDQKKQELGQETQGSGGNTGSGSGSSEKPNQTALTPLIAYLDQYNQTIEASGQVPGVFEDGGTCTLLLVKDSLRVTQETKGFKDFNHVTCTAFSIPRSQLAQAGTWSATLSYSSPSGNGTSQPKTIEVR